MDQRRARGRRTRTALILAAQELFSRDGFDATTVDAITARAEVSPRTFFHHFATKEEVLFDGYAERLAEATARFRAADPAGSLWDALAAASLAVVDAVEEQPGLFLQRARLYAEEPAIRAFMLRVNEEWIDSLAVEVGYRLHVDPDHHVGPRVVAALGNGANRAALEVWVASAGARELRELAMESLALIEPAVALVERSAQRLDDPHRRAS